MYLTASNIVHFLMERDLLPASRIVGHPVAVVESGRRCRNFKIHTGSRAGLFVKQVRSTAAEAVSTLWREARFYELVAGQDDLAALRRILPVFRDFDEGRHALTIDLVPEAENLNELHHRLKRFPPEVGELLGRGLGAYHAEAAALSHGWAAGLFPAQLPWVLKLAPGTLAPLDTFGPNVGPPLIAMLQQRPALMQHLWALGQGYQFDALIHGDMKWDNFVVYPVRKNGAHDLTVIDWELADVGDAAWDIASVFASYIIYVIMSQIQAPAQAAPADPRQDLTLAEARPSMRRFWDSYAETRGLQGEAKRIGLLRTMTYLSGRLVVSAFEGLINATMPLQQAEVLINMADQVAAAPQQAAADLIGPEGD